MTGVYLDYNATAPVRPQAAEAVARAFAVGGNPSSVHASGRAARAIVEDARNAVAALIGKLPIVNVDEITPEMLALETRPTAEEVEAIRALSRGLAIMLPESSRSMVT